MLGIRREEATDGDGAAVLGARRGKTDDPTNAAGRFIAILFAATLAVSLLITGKKKKEEE